LANQLGEDPEDVFALAQKGELRSLFTRTDQQVAAPVTVPPTSLEHRMTNTDLERRRERNRLRGNVGGDTLDLLLRRNANHWHKMRADADAMAALDRSRDAYTQPDAQAQHRAQQEAIRAEALRRRINALAQDGIDAGVTGWGATATHHGPAGPVVVTPRQKSASDWLGH
jgi:hypothetical protein